MAGALQFELSGGRAVHQPCLEDAVFNEVHLGVPNAFAIKGARPESPDDMRIINNADA